MGRQRASHFVNIDRAFENPLMQTNPANGDIFGIYRYRQANNQGYTLVDTRLSFDTGKITVTCLLNNVFNTEYTLRPALMEAPRNIGLRVDYKLN